jgi:protocatechuate 3,4-dioxygenase beta subunit
MARPTPKATLALLALLLAGAAALGLLLFGGGPRPSDPAAGLSKSAGAGAPTDGAAAELAGAQGPAAEASAPALGERQAAGPRAAQPKSASAPRSANKAGPRVLGRVLGPGGRPVADAQVQLERGEPALALVPALGAATRETTRTDAFGQFSLPAKPSALVRFRVEAEGYLDFELPEFTLPADLRLPLEDFVLSPAAVLHGSVVDARGQALAGAKLYRDRNSFNFMGKRPAEATTDERGLFELADQPLGEWLLRVEAEGYPPRLFRGRIDQPGRLAQALRLELPIPAQIAGQALGVPESQLNRVRVRAQPKGASGPWDLERVSTADLAADGSFVLDTLDPGIEYELVLLPASDDPISMTGMAGLRSEPSVVAAGSKAAVLRYLKGAEVRLQAIDKQSRQPIENFSVVMGASFALAPLAGRDGQPLRFHPEGRAVFEDVHPPAIEMGSEQRWRLRVDAPGYVSGRREGFEVPERGQVDLGQIELAQAPIVTVRVVDAQSGKPVRSAQVRLTRASAIRSDDVDMEQFLGEPSARDRTDGEGQVRLTSFAEEPSRLTVVKSGYATHVQEGLVVGLEAREVLVQLFEEGEVEVLVLDSDQRPVRGAFIERERLEDPEDKAGERADGAGRALFRKLVAGAHRFRLRDFRTDFVIEGGPPGEQQQAGEWREVQVASGGKSRLTLVRPARSELEVLVRSKGRGANDISVRLHRLAPGADRAALEEQIRSGQSSASESENTDAGGRALFESIERGEYIVAVRPKRVNLPQLLPIELDQPKESLSFDLPSASVSGRVLDDQGNPVAGARISIVAAGAGNPGEGGSRRWRGRRDDAITVDLGGQAPIAPGETDAEGRFELDSLPAGAELVAWANGNSILPTRSEPFSLGSDEARSGLELRAARAGRLRVELQASGTTRPGLAQGELRRLDGDEQAQQQSRSTSSFAGQALEFGSLPAGRWKLTVRAGSWRDEDRPVIHEGEVTIQAGSETEERVRLP